LDDRERERRAKALEFRSRKGIRRAIAMKFGDWRARFGQGEAPAFRPVAALPI
jgi:hypothetical protein